jgi:Protein of unknown function (DUF2530)
VRDSARPPTGYDHAVPEQPAAETTRPTLPHPEPLDPPMVPFAVAGIVAWAVAGLVLLPMRGWLTRHHHTNWLWTCLAGVLLGFVGLAMMIRRDARRRRRSSPPP